LLPVDPQTRFNSLNAAVRGTVQQQLGPTQVFNRETLLAKIRAAALKQVEDELKGEGLLDADGKVSPQAQDRFSFQKDTSLPTPGILVKGCLDDCSICEPALKQEIALGLKRKELENKLLERQIELLDKSQEYRCCPGTSGSASPPA